jgi:hypothetical protein
VGLLWDHTRFGNDENSTSTKMTCSIWQAYSLTYLKGADEPEEEKKREERKPKKEEISIDYFKSIY